MEELITVLNRIADALGEQNRQNAQWIELQKQWRQQGDPTALRILAIHEANAVKDQEWREVQTQLFQYWLIEQRHIIAEGMREE